MDNVIETFSSINTALLSTSLIFLTFLIFLFIFAKYLPKLPGAIILTPIGILLGYLSTTGVISINLITLGDKFPDISPKLFQYGGFHWTGELIVTSITIAFVAILETMISAKIADGMTKTKHDKRKEILGLSLANITSGLMGGMPATAALARTSLNIKSGATDKSSATVSSIFIIIISFVMLSWFKYIPMAVISAILVYVAIRMVEVEHLKHLYHNDRVNFALALLVAFITVYEDPIFGILIGVSLSLLIFANNIAQGQYKMALNDAKLTLTKEVTHADGLQTDQFTKTVVYSITGQLVYINAQSHLARFESNFYHVKNIILRFREVYLVDTDGAMVLDEIFEICKVKKINVLITGVSRNIESILSKSDCYRQIQKEGKIFPKTSDALSYLKKNI